MGSLVQAQQGEPEKEHRDCDALFSMKRTLRCMKNEAACGYEARLRFTERLVCASLHTSECECFIEAVRLLLHTDVVGVSLKRVPLCVNGLTATRICVIIIPRKAVL